MKLKGLLKGFFILGLTLLPISFSSADNGEFYPPFTVISRCGYQTDNNITTNGTFSTYYNGVEKNNILYFKGSSRKNCDSPENYYVFGWKNGRLYGFMSYYIANSSQVKQGYFNAYGLCDDSSCNLVLPFNGVKNYLESNGIIGFIGEGNAYPFVDGDNGSYVKKYCFITNGQYDVCFFNSIPYTYEFSSGLNYNVSDWNDLSSWDGFFDNTPLSSYNSLPDVPYSGSVPCYTVGQLFESSPKYNTGLCYSSSLQVVGGSLTTVEPQSITQLFPTYSDFRNSLNLYYNYCQSPGTSQSCSDAFSGNYAGYSLISKLPSDVRTNDLYDICSMYLTYGYNKNVCELTGTQITPSYYTSEGYAEYIRQRPIEYITPSSGTLFYGLVKDGGNSAGITNLFGLEQLFSNIMGFFSEYNGNNGILPGFIGFAFLGFCLFYLFKR